jgi:hypothetical protein
MIGSNMRFMKVKRLSRGPIGMPIAAAKPKVTRYGEECAFWPMP